MRKKIFVVVGPTACGKTELAHYIFNKTKYPLFNVDAYQVYKDMNIGTAKIKEDDPYYNKYHLLSYVTPDEEFNIFKYQKDFRLEFDKVIKENDGAILVGGSGLYIKSSLYDYDFSKDDKNIKIDFSNYSNEELYKKIQELDEKALENIHINNRRRLIRCLEIALNNNKNKTEIINNQKHELFYKDFDFYFIFINPNREELYLNINKRCENMFNNGLIDEVKNLLNNYQLTTPALMAAGYLETYKYLNNEITLIDAIESSKKRTRNLAKRQITFFKHQLPCIEFKSIEEAKIYLDKLI